MDVTVKALSICDVQKMFMLNGAPVKLAQVTVGRGSWQRGLRVDPSFDQPVLERYTLALLRAGRVWLQTCRQGVVPLSAGAGTLLQKGCRYHAVQDPEDPGQWSWASFDLVDGRGRPISARRLRLPETFTSPDALYFDATIRRMMELQRRGGVGLATANTLLLALLQDLEQAWADAGATALDARHAGVHAQMTVEAMRLRENLVHPPTTAELARGVGCSREHFCRQFRRVFGCGPHAYLIAARLDLARHLLRTTALPIKAIAAAAGYPDSYSFCKQFRRRVGATPTQYRVAGSGA